ncbi:MAG: VWA domain-containing protein [Pseudomonadales bacterium]
MYEISYPWMFLALLLPFLAYAVLPVYRESKDSIQVPFFQRLVELSGQTPSRGAVVLERLLSQRVWVAFCWLLIVIAMAKPIWIGDLVTNTKSARDLMVAVDLSGSMQATDFLDQNGENIDRLSAVKMVLRDFVSQREHDRLGLIVFGSAAYLQSPFTEDHDTWQILLEESEIGMAGVSTVFGDAIGLAIKIFEHSESDNKVLIVLTDGNDTGSKVPPVDAATVAANKGVTIYTIAIGDPATVGEEAMDIDVMNKIAEVSGGASYQALDREQLAEIYVRIAELEPEEYETLTYRPTYSLHFYPLIIIAGVYCLLYVILAFGLWRSKRGVADV